MISDFEQIEELFREIEQHLKAKVRVFIIGGAVLLYQGLKPATKDIDIIIESIDELTVFENALKTIHFKSETPSDKYNKTNLSQILVRKDFRIDTFHKTVCKKFSLSKNMIERAEKILELENLAIYLCSNEDIFLFKTMTEREGDLEDCISLAQSGINWNVIKDELKEQIHKSSQSVWITWVGERLDLLENRGVNIPIMKEMNKLREKYFEELEKKI